METKVLSYRAKAGKQAKNAELQGSAPSFEEDSGEIGVEKDSNCVPILLGLMQKSVYLSNTLVREGLVNP